MYQVSEAYKSKMLDEIQTHRLKGTLDTSIDFTGEDVIGVSYRNQCSDKKVNVGSVFIGILKLTFLKDLLVRGSYQNKKITIEDGMIVGYDGNDEPIWEDVPVGTFYIADAVWTNADMIEVTAYDCLSFLDKDLQIDTSSGTVYDFCQYIATQTNTVFGMTEEECEALPNGVDIIAPYEESDVKTYRDLLSALAAFIGGFAYADKDGTWKLKTFGDSPVVAIPKNRRMSGAKYSDFTTLYDTISYVNVQDGMTRVYGDSHGMMMKLGSNTFLQYGSAIAIDRRCMNIVEAIKVMKYQPYEASLLPAFVALDLGDVISFVSDYAGQTSKGAVMMFTWTYNKSFKVQCFGDNPNLRAVETQTDKNISGILRSTVQNEVTYYTFANVDTIEVPTDTEVTVASLQFISAQQTTVKIMHELMMRLFHSSGVNVIDGYEVHYYLDGELIPYKPTEKADRVLRFISDEIICRDFYYVLKDVEPNVRHTWEVKILNNNMPGIRIEPDCVHVTLEGQRLYSQEYWGGYIEASDYLTLIPLGSLQLKNITDSASVSTDGVERDLIQASDNVKLFDIGHVGLKGITEGTGVSEPQITITRGFPWATELSKFWASEDGKKWFTD